MTSCIGELSRIMKGWSIRNGKTGKTDYIFEGSQYTFSTTKEKNSSRIGNAMSINREGGWENDTTPTIRTLKHDWRILNDQSKLPDIELDESAHALVNTSMSLLNSHGTHAISSSLI